MLSQRTRTLNMWSILERQACIAISYTYAIHTQTIGIRSWWTAYYIRHMLTIVVAGRLPFQVRINDKWTKTIQSNYIIIWYCFDGLLGNETYMRKCASYVNYGWQRMKSKVLQSLHRWNHGLSIWSAVAWHEHEHVLFHLSAIRRIRGQHSSAFFVKIIINLSFLYA